MNGDDTQYESAASWKKWAIIVAIVLLVVGAGVAAFLVLRSRSGVPAGQPPVNEAVTEGQQTPSALRIQTSADKATAVPMAVPTDSSGKVILNSPQEMSAAEKTALGAPADAQVTMAVTKPVGSDTMVAEITITKPAAGAGSTTSGGATNSAGTGSGSEPAAGEKVTVPVALPTDKAGNLAVDVPKELSSSEKQELGLPPASQATVTVKQAASGQGLVTEISVGPVTQPAGGSAPSGPANRLTTPLPGQVVGVPFEMSVEQKKEWGINPELKAVLTLTKPPGGGTPQQMLTLTAVNPLPPDADNDNVSDQEEARLGTNPNKADSDGDGVEDADEIKLGKNPLKADGPK
jgi:hypothetical protein